MASCAITPGPWLLQVRASSELRCSTSEFRCSESAPAVTITRANRGVRIAGRRICFAAKKKQNIGLDADDFSDFEDEDDEGGSDEEDGLESMQDWKRNKPPGFGVGKEYDLSVETKLLEEIERDRKAQAAAINARKAGGKPTKEVKKPVVEPPPPGFVVRVSNLPKKKNVERDLRTAFQGVQGLLHVRPLHSGNEKTREPTCTGLAFLTFAKEKDADRFISVTNGQLVKFGKVEKKLVMERCRSTSDSEEAVPSTAGVSRLRVRESALRQTSSSATEYLSVLQMKGKQAAEELTPATDNVVDHDVSDAGLRTLEGEIWDALEDEDDDLLDAELEDEESEETVVAANGDDRRVEPVEDRHATTRENQHGSPSNLSIEGKGTWKQKREDDEQVTFHEETKTSVPVSQESEQVLSTPRYLAIECDADDEESDQEDSDGEEFTDMDIELETWGTEEAEDSKGDAARLISREVVRSSSQELERTLSSEVEEKDKKIEELERMVLSLQSKLKAQSSPKQNPVKKLTEEEARQEAEARIEALEKRVFWKVKNAVRSREKSEKSTGKEKVTKRVTERPSKPSPNLKTGKLGAAMRLKKKDRLTFAGVLEKYSRQEELGCAVYDGRGQSAATDVDPARRGNRRR